MQAHRQEMIAAAAHAHAHAGRVHQCEMDDHVVAAKHKLEEIIEFLRDRERRMGERA